jgi:hypothetical protein
MILDARHAVAHWLDAQPVSPETTSRAAARLAVAHQVCPQDLTTTPAGTPPMCPGVAAERRLSVEDAEMRHSRKRRRLLVDGV